MRRLIQLSFLVDNYKTGLDYFSTKTGIRERGVSDYDDRTSGSHYAQPRNNRYDVLISELYRCASRWILFPLNRARLAVCPRLESLC